MDITLENIKWWRMNKLKDGKVYILSPKTEGYQIDTRDDSGEVVQYAHNSRKNAINRIMREIPTNHQLIISDMGEVNHAKD